MTYAWTPVDMDVLVALSAATKPTPIDPVGVASVLWIESAGFNPANPGPPGANPQVGGLNQMSTPNLTGLGLTRAAWLAMSAAVQLPWIFKWWGQNAVTFNHGRFPADGARLLAMNFLPGSYLTSGADANPDAAICGKAGPFASFYAWNTYYDPKGTGIVSVNTIALRQQMDAAAGGARWNQLVADIGAAQRRAGGGPQTPSPVAASSSPPSSGRTGGGGLVALVGLAVVGLVVRGRA